MKNSQLAQLRYRSGFACFIFAFQNFLYMIILNIPENILLFVSGLGLLQGVLLAALVFFHPKSDRSVNKYLALFIFFFSLVMIFPFTLKFISWKYSYFQQPIPLLAGPFLYLYLRSFKEAINWRKALPHFIPFFMYFFFTYWNISSLASQYPDAKEVPAEVLHHPMTILLNYLKFGQSILYYFLARYTLLSYQRSIRQLFSETSRIDLYWARKLINGYMLIIISAVVLFSLMLRYPQHFNLFLLLIMALATPYIYIISYKGIMQPTIWQFQNEANKHIIEEEVNKAGQLESQKFQSQKIRPDRPVIAGGKIDEVVEKIIGLMEQDKLYQETDLTLQDLANKLETPTYQVSLAMNEGMKKNFYDLVNGYRVEEAKRLLLQPKNRNYTILSVGFEAGFNSKTTFNTVFKRFTGLTPTDYRDKQLVTAALV
jgi:AraC-like DNA-binding protein